MARNINIGFWIFLSVLLIIVACVGLNTYNNDQANKRLTQEKAVQEAAKANDNAKAQAECISKNVEPLRAQAILIPSNAQAAADAENAALASCKAQYPTD